VRVFVILCLTGMASAQPFLTDASGSAPVAARPDQVAAVFEVDTEASTASQAADQNSSRTRAAMDAARCVPGASSVWLAAYSLTALNSRELDRALTRFRSRAQIRVVVRGYVTDVRVAEAVREGNGGMAQLVSIVDDYSDTTAESDAALRVAAAEARRNLDALAASAGGQVDRLLSISTAQANLRGGGEFGVLLPIERITPRLVFEAPSSTSSYVAPQLTTLSLSALLAGAPPATKRPVITTNASATIQIEPDVADVRIAVHHWVPPQRPW